MSTQTNAKYTADTTRREYYKFLGVLLLLAAAATLMSTLISFHWSDWLRWFMGGLLLLFGGFKLISYEAFLEIFPRYNPLATKYPWYSYAFPVLEVVLGMFYILNLAAALTYITTLGIMGIGAYGAYHGLLKRGPTLHTVCLGNALRLPLSNILLLESVILAPGAAVMLLSLR
jgi:hypothetical protein